MSRLYRVRVEEMVDLMRTAGARTMLLTLSENFSDWEPVVSVHRADLTPADAVAWQAAVTAGDALAPQDCAAAVQAWERALAIDDQYAQLHFKLAGCLSRLGRSEAACRAYRLASDLDRFSQGAPLSFNAILGDIARQHDAWLVDIDATLNAASGPRCVGDDLFVDAVHPNMRAHQLIAGAIAAHLRQEGIGAASADWQVDAYRDPDPRRILMDDPKLQFYEVVGRDYMCKAAGRTTCPPHEVQVAE
jgi:hypothetical protein